MGLFSFTQEIAMDLGTANTIILHNGKIVVDEPSVVALDRRTDKMVAVGGRAKLMHEKTSPDIRTIRPLQNGLRANDARAHQDGEYSQPSVYPLTAYGDRCTLGQY